MSAPVRLVYIASLSHSGSTLLDLLLNAHSRFASVGELRKFSARIVDGDAFRCTCGKEPLDGCRFWSAVVERLAAGGTQLASLDTDRAETTSPSGNHALLEAISEETGDAIIVDSSKVVRRLALLLSLPDVDLLPVFLVRDPRGQICSTLRKREATLWQAIRDYNRTNRRIMRALGGRPHVLVSYDELVADPPTALQPILAHFRESFEAAQLDWAGREKHSLAGNRMRHGSDSTIRPDDRWRSELAPWQRLAIQTGTWWTRRRIGLGGPRRRSAVAVEEGAGVAVQPLRPDRVTEPLHQSLIEP